MMHALTVHQPWATAIALSDPRELGEVGKGVENRDWEPWKSVVGTHIAIHAGKRPFEAADAIEVGRMIFGDDVTRPHWSGWVARLTAGYGAIVCVARVTGHVRHSSQLRPSQRRWKISESVGWVLEDVRALQSPILIRGAQGLWVVPHDTETKVRSAVGL